MIVQTFYNGVAQPILSTIDAATVSTLMNKTKDEEYNLIKEMAHSNYQWSNECGQPKRVRGKLEVDALTLLTTKVDAMAQRLNRLNVNALPHHVKFMGQLTI